MKNKIFSKITLGGVVAVVFLLAACSDGILPEPLPPPQPLPEIIAGAINPNIIAGQPSQNVDLNTATEGGAKDGSIEIMSGGSVELSWEIKGITSGELSSVPESVLGAPVALEVDEKTSTSVGKKIVSGITSNVTFTITAKNGESEQTVKIVVIVKPLPAQLVINKFEADKTNINAGETVKLCWDVTPTDAAITIEDDKGNTIVSPATVVEDPEPADGEDGLSPTPGFPELEPNCKNVNPTEDTVYTLTAEESIGGQKATKTAEVKIAKTKLETKLKILSFTADPQILKEAGDVKLSWEVTPAEAAVTIDNGIGKVDAKGSKTIKVEQSTVFTLTASLNGETAVNQISVTLQEAAVGVQATISLSANTTSIFAGEEVKFSWSVEGSATEQEVTLALVGPEGTTKISGTTGDVAVKSAVSGAYTAEIALGGSVVRSNQVNVSVRKWSVNKLNIDAVSAGFAKGGQVAVFGVSGNIVEEKSNTKYTLTFGRLVDNNQWEDVSFDIATLVEAEGSYFPGFVKLDSFLNQNPYSINAFATGSNRLYAVGSGLVIYSDDNGKTWKAVDFFPIVEGDSKEVTACKGQKHISKPGKYDSLRNLDSICSLIVDSNEGSDRLIAGFGNDGGIWYIENVDERMADRKNVFWKEGSGLNGAVVNDLISIGSTIYAGTAKGVYSSDNRGESWAAFNGGSLGDGTAIYALAVYDKQFYAGGPDGVFVAKLGGSDWSKAGEIGAKVYSLATDATNGNVYAGTDAGVFVSRDSGKTWVNVTESMGATPTVYDLAIANRTGEVAIYAATSGGVYSSVAPAFVNATKEEATETPPEQPAPEAPAPTAPTATDALKAMMR